MLEWDLVRTFLSSIAAALLLSGFGWWYAESLTRVVVLVPGWLTFRLHHNMGIAFGIQLPSYVQSLLIAVALLVVLAMALTSARDKVRDVGYGIIVGGALANIIDRSFDGLVTDFISVGTFPIFNLADACISIGVTLLILHELKKGGLKESI